MMQCARYPVISRINLVSNGLYDILFFLTKLELEYSHAMIMVGDSHYNTLSWFQPRTSNHTQSSFHHTAEGLKDTGAGLTSLPNPPWPEDGPVLYDGVGP